MDSCESEQISSKVCAVQTMDSLPEIDPSKDEAHGSSPPGHFDTKADYSQAPMLPYHQMSQQWDYGMQWDASGHPLWMPMPGVQGDADSKGEWPPGYGFPMPWYPIAPGYWAEAPSRGGMKSGKYQSDKGAYNRGPKGRNKIGFDGEGGVGTRGMAHPEQLWKRGPPAGNFNTMRSGAGAGAYPGAKNGEYRRTTLRVTGNSKANRTPGAAETMKAGLQALQLEDPADVFIVRRINKLGFNSAEILKQHFGQYGKVKGVHVSHSRVKCMRTNELGATETHWRMRAAGLGFVVMTCAEATTRIFADGPEHEILGVTVQLQEFHRRTNVEDDEAGAENGAGADNEIVADNEASADNEGGVDNEGNEGEHQSSTGNEGESFHSESMQQPEHVESSDFSEAVDKQEQTVESSDNTTLGQQEQSNESSELSDSSVQQEQPMESGKVLDSDLSDSPPQQEQPEKKEQLNESTKTGDAMALLKQFKSLSQMSSWYEESK